MREIFNILRNTQDASTDPAKTLQEVFDRMQNVKDEDLEEPSEDESLEAFEWYEEHALEAYEAVMETASTNSKAKQELIRNSTQDFYATKKPAGAMYTFIYNPETDLKYWDKFPLVLRMLDNLDSPDSFLGINLHYLEPKFRRLFMLNMLTKMTGSMQDKNSRIVGLGMKKLASGFAKYGRVCIRRYKFDNIRGRILQIPPQYWIKMMYLPTYQFIGSKPNRVWRDSFRKIRKLR